MNPRRRSIKSNLRILPLASKPQSLFNHSSITLLRVIFVDRYASYNLEQSDRNGRNKSAMYIDKFHNVSLRASSAIERHEPRVTYEDHRDRNLILPSLLLMRPTAIVLRGIAISLKKKSYCSVILRFPGNSFTLARVTSQGYAMSIFNLWNIERNRISGRLVIDVVRRICLDAHLRDDSSWRRFHALTLK